MKKKLLASLLAIAMMVSMVTPAMAAEAAPADTGYDDKALPTAPIVNGDTITVTPDNAQYTLDGAYGAINGKTIHFSAGDYKDVLVLNRPTKYAGSETQYFNNNKEKKDNPSDLNTNGTCYYARTVQNVTFTADAGATLNGFLASSGHVYSTNTDKAYDYVREHEIVNTNNSYQGYCSLKNVSFEGLILNGSVKVADYLSTLEMSNGKTIASTNDGIHFTNCTFKGDSKKMAESGFAAVKFNADTEYFSNVTVENCNITNYYQGVYVQGVDGLAVCNNVIDNTTHNAIAVQNGGTKEGQKNPVKGTVLIEENVIKNAKDRAIRFGEANTADGITINNNFMIASGDSDGELIKAQSIPENSSVVNLDNNYWNGKDVADVVKTFTPPTKVGVISGKFGCDVKAYLPADLTQDENGKIVALTESNAVAKVGDKYYNTLNAAIDAAQSGETVVLCKNITLTEKINLSKDLTLDFGGNILTFDNTHGIIVDGNYSVIFQNGTIKGTASRKYSLASLNGSNMTVAPSMTIDSEGHGIQVGRTDQGHAILNLQGTIKVKGGGVVAQGPRNILNINGATIHSNHFGVSQVGRNGGTSINLKDSIIVDTLYDGSGVYISNNKTAAGDSNQGYNTLTIDNCNITGASGIETKYTNTVIKGNSVITATASPAVMKPNGNGLCAVGYAISMAHSGTSTSSGDQTAGKMEIENGYFTGAIGIQTAITGTNTAELMVKGGYFTVDPTAYLVDGKAAVGSDKSDYTWMVKDAVPTDVEPAVGEPTVDVSAIPEADQATVQDVVESVEADGLAAYASNEAEKVTDAQQAAAAEALKDAVQGVSDDDIHIYSQAYLAIEATSYDATNKTLTLDITPMVRVVASTADNAENITLEGKNKNAVVLADSDKNLSVSGRVEMNITLPDGFADSKAYVQHKGYEYEATVQNNVATFINPHGFSTFTFSKNLQAVASIGSQSYTDLEAALKDAKDGQTITLLKDGLSATMSGDNRTVHFVGANDTVKTVTVNGQTVNVPGDYTYTASTGGGTVVKRYDVTLADTDNGSITATHKRASKNSTVTITATPAEGYVVDAVTVIEKDGDKVNVTKKDDNKYTFKMPASDVTVKVTFKVAQIEPSGLPFVDVAKDAWYFPAVEYVFNNGLMNGTTATTFAPNVELNRAMMAAVLYNMEGKPACDKSGLFSDVENGKWYTDAVNWAASNNIVSGIPDGTYAPNQALTREQMASILYRYAEYKGIDVSARADLSTFTDGTTVSPWAQDVVQWAVAEKLINGVGTELQPKGTATRAQVATVLMNYCENVAK